MSTCGECKAYMVDMDLLSVISEYANIFRIDDNMISDILYSMRCIEEMRNVNEDVSSNNDGKNRAIIHRGFTDKVRKCTTNVCSSGSSYASILSHLIQQNILQTAYKNVKLRYEKLKILKVRMHKKESKGQGMTCIPVCSA